MTPIKSTIGVLGTSCVSQLQREALVSEDWKI